MLLKIQEFSEFCCLSIRALHLYDKIGLFTPNTTDRNNGYRYYDTDQMKELETILSFKKIGFSLNDIKELKQNSYQKDMVISKLINKKKEHQRQVEFSNLNIEIISAMLSRLDCIDSDIEIDNNHLTKIICMENDKLEDFFSQILWL